jgi:hypothetical protein
MVPLLSILFSGGRSATLRDLDSSHQNEKLVLLSLEEVYPEVYEEWVNQFVEYQVQINNKL